MRIRQRAITNRLTQPATISSLSLLSVWPTSQPDRQTDRQRAETCSRPIQTGKSPSTLAEANSAATTHSTQLAEIKRTAKQAAATGSSNQSARPHSTRPARLFLAARSNRKWPIAGHDQAPLSAAIERLLPSKIRPFDQAGESVSDIAEAATAGLSGLLDGVIDGDARRCISAARRSAHPSTHCAPQIKLPLRSDVPMMRLAARPAERNGLIASKRRSIATCCS